MAPRKSTKRGVGRPRTKTAAKKTPTKTMKTARTKAKTKR